ncbi:MAG: hypothetical protein KKC68_06465 [Candidatus Thermoplasmatota archaeon]|nr:hypothetical protein [Candidatus Thermoplasmatota archaeon]MBU1941402.1 hypothetical protein [Candidatus Thermoplasmatota archaeon]
MNKLFGIFFTTLLLLTALVPLGITQETIENNILVTQTIYHPLIRASITIYVNTTAIDNRNDLNATQKTALKNHILNHVKQNFEGALGTGNVTVTDDSAQQGSADRNITIEPGFSNPPGEAWGQCQGGNNTVRVFLGEFMNDSSVNSSFQNPDGTWNITKLGNALGHTAGHEVGHTYSVGHNHNERENDYLINPPNATDNRSKMTAGQNINATERANIRFNFDNHTKDVINHNADQPACRAFPDYDEKVLVSYFSGPPTLPDRPDEAGSLDVLLHYLTDVPGWYELGFLGEDTDNGLYDGNTEFDFIYKSSLALNPDIDAAIITFIDDMHEHTTWVIRGSELSPYPGQWFIIEPTNVMLYDIVVNPQGREVARSVTMIWPTLGVHIIFEAMSFGSASNPFNGFTYEYVPHPPIITGPTTGEPNELLNYSIVTTDPIGLDVFYTINWGDDTSTEWLGPFPSGMEIMVGHTWEAPGNYQIQAKAKNLDNAIGGWSYYPISIIGVPVLEFGRIDAGILGFAVEFNNTGTGNLTNLNWQTSMEGGFIFYGKEASGTIDYIQPGTSEVATIVPVIGLGRTTITILADSPVTAPISKTVDATVLFIFVFLR